MISEPIFLIFTDVFSSYLEKNSHLKPEIALAIPASNEQKIIQQHTF